MCFQYQLLISFPFRGKIMLNKMLITAEYIFLQHVLTGTRRWKINPCAGRTSSCAFQMLSHLSWEKLCVRIETKSLYSSICCWKLSRGFWVYSQMDEIAQKWPDNFLWMWNWVTVRTHCNSSESKMTTAAALQAAHISKPYFKPSGGEFLILDRFWVSLNLCDLFLQTLRIPGG